MYNLKDENDSRINRYVLNCINSETSSIEFNFMRCFPKDSHVFYFDTIENIDYVWSIYLCKANREFFVDGGGVANKDAFHATNYIKVANDFGKMNIAALETALQENKMPALVYLNNTTDAGVAYSEKEIWEIYTFCNKRNILLYVNGDRLANAVADWRTSFLGVRQNCDMLSIGGTRYGIFFGVVCIVFNQELKLTIDDICIKAGLSFENKGLIQKQFGILFNNNEYTGLGKNANNLAYKLQCFFQKKKLGKVVSVYTNHVKVILSRNQHNMCSSLFRYNKVADLSDDEVLVEFVTNWETTEKEILDCIELISMATNE